MSADDGMPSAAQVEAAEGGRPAHSREPHAGGIPGPLNWLREAVLLVALALTGAVSARPGGSKVRRAVLRVVVGGALGLAFTYGVGNLFGTAIH